MYTQSTAAAPAPATQTWAVPCEPEHPQTPRQRPRPIPERARRPRQPIIVGQCMPQYPWPSAPGVKTCPQVGEAVSSGERQCSPPSGTAQAGQRTASPRPRPSHHHTHLHITYLCTCPPSLNSAGVWRSGHTRGPAAPQPPQPPNQQNNSSSRPLPPRAATRQQGCGKTPPLAPLVLQYFLIVSDKN